MKNSLDYSDYEKLVDKVDELLRSFGINPVREDGSNDPRADLILGLVGEMLARDGWVAISNCYFRVSNDKRASPLVRLEAVVGQLRILTEHHIASKAPLRDEHRIKDCQRAITAAMFLMTCGGPSVLEEAMNDAFSKTVDGG